jgi:hypothetical protein
MLFRAIALTLALLIGMGTIIPLATNTIEAGPHKTKTYKGKKKYRKYSKAWWRQYHARQRRKMALAARKRMMRLHQIRMAKAAQEAKGGKSIAPAKAKSAPESTVAVLPSGAPAPQGWKKGQSSGSELQFSVDNGNASAAISVVGPATGETVATGRNRSVGGVPTASLRREVINRMVRENGWVVNDYQKEVGDKQVYVVVAQSQSTGGRVQSRMFYFTEVDGRIYSVAMNSNPDAATRLAEESEKVIFSLGSRPRPTQQAVVKQ